MSLSENLVGRKYPPMQYEVGREKIKEYAKAIKNPDPHYVDDEFAAKSKYGTIIAPPTFAVVYAANNIEPILFDKELDLNLAMVVHGEQDFEFIQVVKSGDTITTEAEITGVENKEKLDVMSVLLISKNQDDEDVCRAVYTFVVRK